MAGTDSRTSKEVAQPQPVLPQPGHTGLGKATETEARTHGYKRAAPNPATLLARSTKRKLSSAATGLATEPLAHGALMSGAVAGLLRTTRRQTQAFQHTPGKHSPGKQHHIPRSSQQQESKGPSQPAKNTRKESCAHAAHCLLPPCLGFS